MVLTILRKKGLYAFMLAMVLTLAIWPQVSEASSVDTKAKSAIIVDVETGEILFEKDADKALPPASMTKMMTEYLILEKINNDELSWETTTEISDYAYSISANNDFSGVGLVQDVDYTVRDLYNAMAINSDNATTIALAELVAGSEGEFVQMMNKKGEELGLSDFKFVNSTGLNNSSLDGNHPKGTKADDMNLMSAKTSAQLAYHLVNDYPEVLDVSSKPKEEFDDKEILNYNWMLDHDATHYKPYFYKGVDGLKTGHTDEAGYTFTSTAERDGRRLVTVVMKTKSEQERFQETAKLLDYGFEQFEEKELFPAGYTWEKDGTAPVAKGKEDKVEVALKEAITASIKKGTEDKYSVEYTIDKDLLNKDGELEAPIKKGDKVGTAKIVFDGDEDFGYILDKDNTVTTDVIAVNDVEKKNWFSLMLGAIGQFFVNLYDKFMGLF